MNVYVMFVLSCCDYTYTSLLNKNLFLMFKSIVIPKVYVIIGNLIRITFCESNMDRFGCTKDQERGEACEFAF